MSTIHRVTGYDKRTELLAFAFDVPADHMTELRRLANVDPADDEALGSYPLDSVAARALAHSLNLPMAVERCDWFLEPIAVR